MEADNPDIGLMCFIGIGMDEVSTCDITVKEGEHVKKGQCELLFELVNHIPQLTPLLGTGKSIQLNYIELHIIGSTITDFTRHVPLRGVVRK